MQLTVNIPDSIFNDLKNIDPNIENTIIKAIELYTNRKKLSKNDPLTAWLKTPVKDRENKDDISEKHNSYLYGFEK